MRVAEDPKRKILKFAPEMTNILKSYVYIYVDPRNGESFYVGRGKGNRSFAHLNERTKMKKVARIFEIRKSGAEPRIELLRYGMTIEEASLVEAAAIDLLGFSKLTNAVRGNHRGTFGRISSKDLITMLTARPARIEHEAILVLINRLYRSDMSAGELYEATRGIWKIGSKRDRVEYAMAVYQVIIREVYRIREWLPAGTLKYETRDSTKFKGSGRWEFKGEVANDVRDQYVGFSVRHILTKARNPIRYIKPL
jgi:uncharacterized protein